jgi:hypothetical protein
VKTTLERPKKNQCEAVTQASTYSAAHRCLKARAAKNAGTRKLCVHHQNMESAAQPVRRP